MLQKLRRDKFSWFLGLIILLAAILRLRGFDNHFLLSSDTARDILTAKGAILLQQLPWVGSFSSSGPFVFGPNWYWQLMLPQILFPNYFWGPWAVMLLISLFFIVIMGFCGRILGGKRLGLITALLTAVSPAVIGLSAYPTQHAMVEIFSALALLGFLAFLKTKKLIFAFLMATSIGGGISYHYQAINLLPYYGIILGFYYWESRSTKEILKLIFILIFGSFIFLIPLLLWDSSRGFANTLHLIGYFKVGQYQIYIPNSWRIYLFSFWPSFLGKLIGGNFQLGVLIEIFVSLIIATQFIRRKLSLFFLSLLTVFIIQFLLMRYFRGERYDGYLVYFHPIILILVAFTVNTFLKITRWVSFILVLGLMSFLIWITMPILDWHNDADNLMKINSVLKSRFPGQKFSLYARSLTASNVAFSQSLTLERDNLGDDKGRLLGVCLYSCGNMGTEIIKSEFQGQSFMVVDLTDVKKNNLTKENGWYSFSAVAVYDDVQNWWKK